jgi:L-lactate dehydrogenase complex protein LldG
MSAREAILSRIRQSLGADAPDTGRRTIVIARLEGTPRGVIPKRGQLLRADRMTLFREMAEKVSATVARVEAYQAVPEAIAEYLRAQNLAAKIRMGDDARLKGLPWKLAPHVMIGYGPSDGSDRVGVTHAIAGVAESGTLVLASGPDNPTTLNFLPEFHIVVIRGDDILGDYETVWDTIRVHYGRGTMPRTVNFITGPSRSADIEQTLLLGAHGPRRLHIVVVG